MPKGFSIDDLRIIDDEPSPNSPFFQFEAYSKKLGTLLLDPNLITPFVIGLNGEWGSGKTTLLKKTLDYVNSKKDNDCKTIWFDAWKFEKYDPVLALFQKISDTYSTLSDSIGKIMLGTGSFLFDIASRKGLGMSLDEIKKHYQDTISVVSTISEKVENAIGNNGRLIIFIDDLDRCENENILKILFSIKEILNAKKVVFILGIDMKKIERAWDLKYRGYEKAKLEGKDHVDKLFQLKISIPIKYDEDIDEYVKTLITLPSHLQSLLNDGTRANPRKIKHTVNMIYFTLKDTLLDPDSIDLDAIVVGAIIHTCHPNLIQTVSIHPISLIQASFVCRQAGEFSYFKTYLPNIKTGFETNPNNEMRIRPESKLISKNVITSHSLEILDMVEKDIELFYFLKAIAESLSVEFWDKYQSEYVELGDRVFTAIHEMPFFNSNLSKN